MLRSKTGPFGPYEIRPLEIDAKSPVPGSGVPHQGGIVQTPKGDWYYMAFIDAFPGGRVPVLAPLTWDADGWPHVQMTDNTWAPSYPMPDPSAAKHPIPSHTGTYAFKTAALSPEWEWNHNLDNTSGSAGHIPTLQAATVTDDSLGTQYADASHPGAEFQCHHRARLRKDERWRPRRPGHAARYVGVGRHAR